MALVDHDCPAEGLTDGRRGDIEPIRGAPTGFARTAPDAQARTVREWALPDSASEARRVGLA